MSVAVPWKSVNRTLFILAGTSGILLLAATIAIPNLLRSRTAADQARAMWQSHDLRLYSYPAPESSTVGGRALMSAEQQSVAVSAELKAGKSAVPSAAADRKMIRTGFLDLTVKSPAEAAEQIRRMAESMGGYLESAQVGGTKEAPTATITIRVPATRFEDAKAGIRQLAARVESEKTEAQDVTRQYVDREARLRNLRAEEAQYLVIMKSAYKVEDLLSVSEKLSEVRGQIEQQQAEFQTLSKQVETVAITISLRAVADAQVFGLNWRPLYQLKLAARDGLDALADYASAMATILFFVPVILAWGITILLAIVICWRVTQWVGRRFFASPAAAVPKVATQSNS
jgi:hypothetical protein